MGEGTDPKKEPESSSGKFVIAPRAKVEYLTSLGWPSNRQYIFDSFIKQPYSELQVPKRVEIYILAPSGSIYEDVRQLSKKVTQLDEMGHQVTVLVSATGANRSGTIAWTTQWNNRQNNFPFKEVCSCSQHNGESPHHRFHVLNTAGRCWQSCREVPSLRPGHRAKTHRAIDFIWPQLQEKDKSLASAGREPSFHKSYLESCLKSYHQTSEGLTHSLCFQRSRGSWLNEGKRNSRPRERKLLSRNVRKSWRTITMTAETASPLSLTQTCK